MKKWNLFILALLSMVCVLGVSACGDDDDSTSDSGTDDTGTGDTGDTGTAETGDTGTAETGDTGGGQATQLTSSHPGWQNPSCLSSGCHTTDTHNTGKLPGECATCHGNNGAKDAATVDDHGESEPAGCKCHMAPKGHTPAEDFPSPAACKACH